MKRVGIIPARYASTRFPGKPLAMIAGKSVIQRVYEQAMKARRLDEVIVATDDQRIVEAIEAFGGRVMMTSSSHQTGTERCAEVAGSMDNVDIVVNIQGDEPFIAPGQIDMVVEPLARGKPVQISTLARQLVQEKELFNPNVVKVVFNRQQLAIYFSRSTIPHLRQLPKENWLASGAFYKHIGLYGFRRDALLELAALPPGKLEQWESLEQLRWLEEGYSIFVNLTEEETIGIDTPEDLERAIRVYGGNEGMNE